MAQLFPPSTNIVARVTVLGSVILAAGAVAVGAAVARSDYSRQVGVSAHQPVPFSHEHHVTVDGLDCRFCHWPVEDAAFAGIPSTEVCLLCHWVIWPDSEVLAPIRASASTGRTPEWVRVHDLPDFVVFDHAIHVQRGVGCDTCHGRVDRMPLVHRTSPLTMRWCLDCHRDPARWLRPESAVFDPLWQPPDTPEALGSRLAAEKGIRTEVMADCTRCHR